MVKLNKESKNMRTETITRDLYTFSELSEEAKERAKEEWVSHHLDFDLWWNFSDEYVEECLICNEYEFTSDGKVA